MQCRLYTGSEVPAFTETWLLTPRTNISMLTTQLFYKIFSSTCLWCNFWFHWQHTLFFRAVLYTHMSHTPLPSSLPFLHSGIHFSLHCGNWHSMVGAIVNMAVWDWYKEAPVTPQAKLVCEAGRGCCLLCWWSLCRFAVGPFLIAFSYIACRLALHI